MARGPPATRQENPQHDRLEWAEALSYIVTIFGLPPAILVSMYEQRRERQGEEEELCQRLSDEYTRFLKLVLGNLDLHLLRKTAPHQPLTEKQQERKPAIFSILISLFERACLLVFEEKMDRQTQRLCVQRQLFSTIGDNQNSPLYRFTIVVPALSLTLGVTPFGGAESLEPQATGT